MARRPAVPPISDHQSRYILEKLIDEGTVSAADVRRHIAGMWQEMGAIERRIEELRSLAGSVHPIRRVKETARKVRKRMASPEVSASRQLQGRYIAAIRNVGVNQRERFRKIAKGEGREAAIAAIQKHRAKTR